MSRKRKEGTKTNSDQQTAQRTKRGVIAAIIILSILLFLLIFRVGWGFFTRKTDQHPGTTHRSGVGSAGLSRPGDHPGKQLPQKSHGAG